MEPVKTYQSVSLVESAAKRVTGRKAREKSRKSNHEKRGKYHESQFTIRSGFTLAKCKFVLAGESNNRAYYTP